ncbi:hypothetical protein ACI8AF_00355 [Blastococcus sp. SYSU D00669]
MTIDNIAASGQVDPLPVLKTALTTVRQVCSAMAPRANDPTLARIAKQTFLWSSAGAGAAAAVAGAAVAVVVVLEASSSAAYEGM